MHHHHTKDAIETGEKALFTAVALAAFATLFVLGSVLLRRRPESIHCYRFGTIEATVEPLSPRGRR